LRKEHNKDKERDKAIKNALNRGYPSYPYIENMPYINYSEGSLALMSEKNNGKPKYDWKVENYWISPYIIKNKSKKENYYLIALYGRKIPFPMDGSLLHPYAQIA
jgi:hypothetical protein